MSFLSKILNITEKDFKILKKEVREDLLVSLTIIKKLALIFGFILAPWIPAYVVQKTIVDQHQAELSQYLNTALGGLIGYTDTLFTLNELCKEYRRTSETERVKNRFYQRFDYYMQESIKWRERFSADSATIQSYLGPRVNKLRSDFMFMNAYYGFTPQEYCSHPALDLNTLICKERAIRKAAIEYRPSLQEEIPFDKTKKYGDERIKGGIVCPP